MVFTRQTQYYLRYNMVLPNFEGVCNVDVGEAGKQDQSCEILGNSKIVTQVKENDDKTEDGSEYEVI